MNTEELSEVDMDSTDALLGLFSDSHMEYEDRRGDNQPSITDMVDAAIQVQVKHLASIHITIPLSANMVIS